jgi:glycosyltransferase 2 family protein
VKKYITYIVKLGITALLIWYFLGKINIIESFGVLVNTNIAVFIFSLFVVGVSWFFNAMRWRYILKMVHIDVSPWKLYLYNLIGNFYGIVLPGGKLSGDLMCAYRFTKDQGEENERKKYFLSVFADRFSGMLVMLIFFSLYFVFGVGITTAVFEESTWLVGVLVIILSIGGLVAMFSSVFDFFITWIVKFPSKRIQSLVQSLIDALKIARHNKRESLISFWYSFLAVFVNIIAMYVLGVAIGINVGFFDIGFAFLGATLLITIPITVAGIGLREGGTAFILNQAGAGLSQAVAYAVLALFILILYSAVGGFFEFYSVFLKKNPISTKELSV